AIAPRTPLPERVKFLSIFSNNLDGFFMVRVAGLKRQLSAGVTPRSPDGLTPQQQLAAIARRLGPLIDAQQSCLANLLGRLADNDVMFEDVDSLSPPQVG